MRFDVVTCFPDMIRSYADEAIIGRAEKKGIIEVNAVNLRDFARDRYRHVDDTPYGGGPGMLLRCDVAIPAVESCMEQGEACRVIYTSPAGRRFDQKFAEELRQEGHTVILCGRYEGIDQRIIDSFGMEEVSLGDYILTGGELCALCIIDAVTRLIPGVLGDDDSSADESFSSGLLEYPQYTKPAEYRGMKAPEVLQSGNHREIALWKRAEMLKRTLRCRPDLLQTAPLSEDDRKTLERLKYEEDK